MIKDDPRKCRDAIHRGGICRDAIYRVSIKDDPRKCKDAINRVSTRDGGKYGEILGS
ncbi:MAG: hypothetical protein ABH844_02125 [Candidatus Omnitrophota bacterium]